MDDIEGKRVYRGEGGGRELFVACDLGVVSVDVADGRVGSFGVARRCAPRGVAGAGGRLAVATDGDVLVGEGGEFEATGFGPAVAVGFDGGALHAGASDGRIARIGDGITEVGAVEGVRAIDGDLVAAEGGVYRIGEGLSHAGLSDARDVSAGRTPMAATADGLYALGNGWMDALEGDFRLVSESPDGALAHAATGGAFHERDGGEWRAVDVPAPVAGVAYGACPYAVTRDGTLLARDGDGWRSNALGVAGVVGMAAP